MNEQHQSFEQLKQTDEHGAEYWSARSLSKLLNTQSIGISCRY